MKKMLQQMVVCLLVLINLTVKKMAALKPNNAIRQQPHVGVSIQKLEKKYLEQLKKRSLQMLIVHNMKVILT